MEAFGGRMVSEARELRGRWLDHLSRQAGRPLQELYLELGCGKGRFVITHALEEVDAGFVAVDGQLSVAILTAESLINAGADNVALIGDYINDIREYFAAGELDGIYLNFSDPWPKVRHARRRLTYRDRLARYAEVLKPGGFVEFKTDNDDFYQFTLKEIEACGFEVQESTTDLHSTGFESARFTTEYEEKFSSRGKNISYVKFTV
jgi:tRNA (guanine-N7-)-methyltransferase